MDLFDFAAAQSPEPSSAPVRRKAEPVILSVSQLTRQVRDLLEDNLGAVWVQGEISNYRRQASGHHYFTLKDAEAQLSCVLFRGNAQYVSAALRDGLQVQALGDISVYEARGQYQMIIRKVQEAGVGALQMKFEALKRRLADEGLFDAERKQAIPKFPRTVAIVTSPTGAALRDMLNILGRRSPWVRVLVFPVRVQGEGAHLEITDAIRRLSQPLPGLPPIDTVVVARGGGSLEDLWSFNEESVARAIADCPLPVISAVGHEIDFTISDFAADLRAPTPSAAAELLAPDREEIRRRLGQFQAVLHNRVRQSLEQWRRVLALLGQSGLFRAPDRWLEQNRQHLDSLREELDKAAQNWLSSRLNTLELLRRRLEAHRPEVVLQQIRSRLMVAGERMEHRIGLHLERRRQRLRQAAQLLQSLGPAATLARGFSYTTKKDGQPITRASEVESGEEILTTLADGQIRSRVKERKVDEAEE